MGLIYVYYMSSYRVEVGGGIWNDIKKVLSVARNEDILSTIK